MLLERSEHALTMEAETLEAGQNLVGDGEDDDKSQSIKQVVGGSYENCCHRNKSNPLGLGGNAGIARTPAMVLVQLC